MFKGLSTLRKHERKAAANTEESKKLQAYLSKYTSSNGTCQTTVIKGLHSVSEAELLSWCTLQQNLSEAFSLRSDPSMCPYACDVCIPLLKRLTCAGDDGSEKKRRKKKKVGGPAAGLRIVDEDATGFRTGPAARMQGDDDDAEDEDEGSSVSCNHRIILHIAFIILSVAHRICLGPACH